MENKFQFKLDERNLRLILNQFKTNAKLKWIIILGFVIIPYTLVWILLGGNDNSNFFWFRNPNTAIPYLFVDYGMQWLIAMIWSVAVAFIIFLLSKYNKNIKRDIYMQTTGWTFAMINFWLIPIGYWTILLGIPFYIIGVIFAFSIQIAFFINEYQKKINGIKTDFNSKIDNEKNDGNKNDQDNKNLDDDKTIDVT